MFARRKLSAISYICYALSDKKSGNSAKMGHTKMLILTFLAPYYYCGILCGTK